MIIFLRTSFQSHQTRILNAGLGMAWNRYGLSCNMLGIDMFLLFQYSSYSWFRNQNRKTRYKLSYLYNYSFRFHAIMQTNPHHFCKKITLVIVTYFWFLSNFSNLSAYRHRVSKQEDIDNHNLNIYLTHCLISHSTVHILWARN